MKRSLDIGVENLQEKERKEKEKEEDKNQEQEKKPERRGWV